MKKLVILVLLVPMLALTMISCDADMRSNLAGWMGGFNGNVYADAGFIVPNTAQAEAAAATIAAIGTGTGATATGTTGFGVTLPSAPAAPTMLAAQTPAKQKELKDNLGDAFNSPTQKEKLLEDLKKTVAAGSDQQKAAQGTVEVLNATLTELKNQLGTGNTELGKTLDKLKLPVIADGDDLTQGDLLALQLMADLISNTVTTLNSFTGGLAGATDAAIGNSTNKDKVLSIIDDALFAAEVAEQISGAASIDFTGQLDLGSLMEGIGGDKGSRAAGDSIELTEAEDFLGTINALAPSIVKLMGISYNSSTETFSYPAGKYKSFLLNQQIYRSSMEQALKMMEYGDLGKKDIDALTFDTSTLVKYALAVFITEHHAFVENKFPSIAPDSVIIAYLNENKNLGLGKLEKSDVLTEPSSSIDYDEWPGFLKTLPRDLSYLEAIITNIIMINDEGGIAQLSTELKKFRDAAIDEDGLAKWYDEL